jgi:hypothetical protein
MTDSEEQPSPKRGYRFHVHTFQSLGFGELLALMAPLVNTFAFVTNIVLIAIVNNETLSTLWNTLTKPLFQKVPLSTLVTFSLVATPAVWLVIVYILYDCCGLYN